MALLFFDRKNKPMFQCEKCMKIFKYPKEYCYHIVNICNVSKIK